MSLRSAESNSSGGSSTWPPADPIACLLPLGRGPSAAQ